MIYNEIMDELEQIPEGAVFAQRTKSAMLSLFKICQRYLTYYEMNQKLNSAKGVLDNYLNAEDCLNTRKQKGDREREPSLNITSKLYIEFFWEKYKEHYNNKGEKNVERKFFNEIINGGNIGRAIDKAWGEIFSDSKKDMNSLKESVIDSIMEWASYDNATYIKNLNLSNLHNAMIDFEKGIKITVPSIEESIEIVIAPDILDFFLDCLRDEAYPSCLFTIAPMARALFDGKINSYIKGNTTVYFNFVKGHEHNLSQLEKYINVLQGLYDEYIEVRTEIEEYL